jgi:hypothetical protein
MQEAKEQQVTAVAKEPPYDSVHRHVGWVLNPRVGPCYFHFGL